MVKNTCPKPRIPINNKCLQSNTYIKKNKQDFDCCYKLAKSKSPLVQSAKKSPIPKVKVVKVKAPKKVKSPLVQSAKKSPIPKVKVVKVKAPKKVKSPLVQSAKKSPIPKVKVVKVKAPKKVKSPLVQSAKKSPIPKVKVVKVKAPKKVKSPLVQSPKKSPIPKVKAPKKEKVEKTPIIYTNFYENLEKLLNEVEKDVNKTISNGEGSEHYDHEVFEITALDKESGSVNNIINILKQKFNPIEVLEKSKNLAVLHYKTIFIGFHTKKSKDEIMVLIGTDATELGISNWFNWDGRFD